MEDLQPLSDIVFIKAAEAAEKTDSGLLYIPEIAKGELTHTRSTVAAAGPDCQHVKVGDKVVFHPMTGTGLMIGDTKYVVMRESQLMAVIR